MQTGETSGRIVRGEHTPPPAAPNGASEHVEAFTALVRGESAIGERAETVGAAPAQGVQDFGSIKRARMVRIPPSQPDPADLGTFKTTDYGRFRVGPKEGPLYPVLDTAGNRTEFAIQENGSAFVLGVVRATAGEVSFSQMSEIPAGFRPTDTWGGKFRYGALSALISSYVVGKVFSDQLHRLETWRSDPEGVRGLIDSMQRTYVNMSPHDVETILAMANNDQFGGLFDTNPSVVHTPDQNRLFIRGMRDHPELQPVDDRASNGFRSDNFEFNAHRGLYNQSLGIAQNSLASYVNAYIAGERSLELDVLETADGQVLTVHDLAINRLIGKYDGLKDFVEHKYSHHLFVNRGIVDPTAAQPNVMPTASRVGTLDDCLQFFGEYLPHATVHLDARNYSPLSSAHVARNNLQNFGNVNIKVYPFTLPRGFNQILTAYASRYTGGDEQAARQQLQEMNITVCAGLIPDQADESVLDDSSLSEETFASCRDALPFTGKSGDGEAEQSAAPTTPLSGIAGVADFKADELEVIERRTRLIFQYLCGFIPNMKTNILQLGSQVSLIGLIEKAEGGDTEAKNVLTALSSDERIGAAVNDNVIRLVRMVRKGDLTVHIPANDQTESNARMVAEKFAHLKLGSSDRYPDFAMAQRDDSGRVIQDTLQEWVYYIVAGEVRHVDPGKVVSRTGGAKCIPYREPDFRYMTTDGIVDLRADLMDILGQSGLPAELLFNPNGMIRQARTSYRADDSPTLMQDRRAAVNYEVPAWAKSVNPDWKRLNLDGASHAAQSFKAAKRTWEVSTMSATDWCANDFAQSGTRVRHRNLRSAIPGLSEEPSGIRFKDGSRALKFIAHKTDVKTATSESGETDKLISGFEDHLDKGRDNIVAVFFNSAGQPVNVVIQKVGLTGSVDPTADRKILEYNLGNDKKTGNWREVPREEFTRVMPDMGWDVPTCVPPVYASAFDLEGAVEAIKSVETYHRSDRQDWVRWMTMEQGNWAKPLSPRTTHQAGAVPGLMFQDNSRAIPVEFAGIGTDQWNWGQQMDGKTGWILLDNNSRPTFMVVLPPRSDSSGPTLYRYGEDHTWQQTSDLPGPAETESPARRAPLIPLGGAGGVANTGALFQPLAHELLAAGFDGMDQMPVSRLSKIAPHSRQSLRNRVPAPTGVGHIFQGIGEDGGIQMYLSKDGGTTYFAINGALSEDNTYFAAEDPSVAYKYRPGAAQPWTLEFRPAA